MKVLNQSYINLCKPKCTKYEKITENITLISDFFENFEDAKKFFTNREIWECISYQNHSKRGYESVFPDWVGRSLMEMYILQNKIIDDLNSYKIICNYFYDNEDFMWSLSNSSYIPHIDSFQVDDELEYICLINLHNISISTNFYTYKDVEYCSREMEKDWIMYINNIEDDLLKYYNKKNITRDECKKFLMKKKYSNIKLIREVKYKPNEAIIYPANLFHSPNLTTNFTKNNPRISLRISFYRKINK